jgi:hypothetical protein
MSHVGRGYDINQTFIIEPMASSGGTSPVVSACTAVYTNVVESCSGNTQILLGNGQITFDGNLYTNDNLSASTINASTYFSGGTNLFDIISLNNITGGTFNNNTDTLTLFKQNNSTVVVTGFTDYYTTGATLIGNTVYFNRNDSLSAYTLSLSALSTTDIYTTGVTFNNNQLVITRNDGVSVNTFINNFTGLTINGLLTANSISANTISATTFYGDGSNLTGISTQDTFVTGGTYSNGTAIFTNNTGGTFTVSGFATDFTGGTVNGLTATTISATTYLGLPIDVRVTGGTYSNGVATFTNNTGGTFNVSGFVSNFTGGTVDGLTATTISATTYLGLPVDIRVTGGTYFQGNTTFINNTGGTFNIIGPSNYNAGVLSGATWTNNNNGSISLPQLTVGLFDNADYLEPLRFYTISSGTTGVGGLPALTNNDTNYILIEYNNGSPRYNVSNNTGTVNGSDVLLYMVVYRLNNFVHTLEFGNEGAGMPNKITQRILNTDRFARESGFELGLSGSTGIVEISAGVSWNAIYRQSLSAVDSLNDEFFKVFHSGGTWVYTLTGTTVNNSLYDNGTNVVSATTGNYLVNWYFRGQETGNHIYEVFGNNEYTSVLDAEASVEPSLPELITSHAFLVGRIIVGVGLNTGITQSAFSTVFQPSGAAGIHNDLLNIQGGSPNEYYHLSSNEYNNLAYTNLNNNFNIGQTFNGGLTATTISATTYLGLPIDIRVTGGTYSNGTAIFTNNTGGTFNVSGLTTGDTYWTSGSTGAFSIKTKNNSAIDATGAYSVAEGSGTTASGVASHAEGQNTTASGDYSHAEGQGNTASGAYSHAEGNATTASGDTSHAEGFSTITGGPNSHAEGVFTIAIGEASHAEGFSTTTEGLYSHAEGQGSIAIGVASHAEGNATIAIGDNSHAEGNKTTASNNQSHAEGYGTTASGENSHAEGSGTIAIGIASHSEGESTTAVGDYSHAEGLSTIASGYTSHAEGYLTIAVDYAHAEGGETTATGLYSHAEGNGTIASGDTSHAEGYYTIAGDSYAHAEGGLTKASGDYSHAEGNSTTASGRRAHSEGLSTTASAPNSHAEGSSTIASSDNSHAEGYQTIASGFASHAEGSGTIASGSASHAEGSGTTATGTASHAKGYLTTASGSMSYAEGNTTTATGIASHAEGFQTIASGNSSHAEGSLNRALGQSSHAEGNQTTASGNTSHAEGLLTTAQGDYSHAEGRNTRALGETSHAEGSGTTSSNFASHTEGQNTTASGQASHAEGFNTRATNLAAHAEGSGTTASGLNSHAEGTSTIASGTTAHAEGQGTIASGQYSHAGGFQSTASGTSSFIHSTNSIVTGARSVVLGGENITGATADTVYVPRLNVKFLSGGTTVNNVGIDANGFLVVGTAGGGGTFTGGTVNGATVFTNGLSANTFNITTTPTNNNSNTQILSRNSSSGNIEYIDSSSISASFNYGLSFAIANSVYLT